MQLSRCPIAFAAMFVSTLAFAQDNVDTHMVRAGQAIDAGDSQEAVDHLSKALAANDKLAIAYYLRGRELFRLGKVKQAASDFDTYVELKPGVESRQWERGIADYYAGNYDKGAKQFALYQTYHDNDVENAVWRYLCMAAAGGNTKQAVEKARAELLPIENDRRVPMMQIYALYRGKMSPAEVLAAIEAGEPGTAEKNARLFYAHLYLGLYYAAEGNQKLEREHILKSEQHKIGHYMWDVAHVHADLLRNASKE